MVEKSMKEENIKNSFLTGGVKVPSLAQNLFV